MSIPNCPTHNVPMKVSKMPGVSFYCTQRTEDGEYCKQSIKAPKPTSIATVPATSLLPKSSVDSHDVLAAAALEFAAMFWKGAGPEMADDALALAIRVYSAMKAVL